MRNPKNHHSGKFYDQLNPVISTKVKYNAQKNIFVPVNPLRANPTNGQTHSNNSPAIADELFECSTIFWGWRLKG